MFSTSEIVHNTNAKSFDRGSAIASREGAVTARAFSAGRSICDISAEVRSQSGIAERFNAYIATDSEIGEIVDYECSCPAARKYDTMCKHCVAVALAFKSDPSSFDGFENQLLATTSRSIKRFLDRAPSRADRRLDEGSAHLDLELTYGFGEWGVKLDVSAGGSTYVVSDLGAFSSAIIWRKHHSYGKRLSFVHALDAFDEQSREVALLISELAADASGKRELSLKAGDVVRILDSLNGASFSFTNHETGQERFLMSPSAGNPEIDIRILPLDGPEGGYEIIRDAELLVASGPEGAYVFMDGVAYRCSDDFAPAALFLSDVYLSADDELVFSREDAPKFCSVALPLLDSSMNLSYPRDLELLRPKDAALSFYFDKTGKGRTEAIELVVKVSYGQGDKTLLAPSRDAEALPETSSKGTPLPSAVDDAARLSTGEYFDKEAEDAAVELAFEYFDATMTIPLDDEEAAGALLYEGISRFQEMGSVFTTPDFDRLITDRKARVQIGLSLAGNLINMDLASSDLGLDEISALLSSYQKKRKYHRLKDGSVASLRSMELERLDRISQDFGIPASALRSGTVELPTYSAFLLDREYAEANRSRDFEDYVHAFDDSDLYMYELPKALDAQMRPYQVDGYRWLSKLSSIGFGGILADEMGLGKSLQTIAFLLSRKQAAEGVSEDMAPALIVCPASLVYNWVEEFAKFAPSLATCPIDGTRTERRRKRSQEGVDVFIASYDAVRMDSEAFEQQSYSTVVLDEAQFIKNHATKTSRAVKRLSSQNRFALTGTPIENRLSELWSIFDFLMPGFLGTYAQFRRRFEADIIGGDEEVARHLQALVEPFVLRRMKSEVLTELPEKQESVISVALDGEQRRLYEAHEQNLKVELLAQRKARKGSRRSRPAPQAQEGVKVDVLAELMRLRQVALDPSLVYNAYKGGSAKTQAILELIAEAQESGRKALVFSQFTSYLDILKSSLEERGVTYSEITGSTPKKDRIDLVNDFNSNDVPVFLVSLKAGGTGLNLIGASIVIHADPWWNSAAVNQATDRAHRIGQREMVSVYKVIAKDTIEERILRLQEAKEELAGSVVGETSLATLSSLTRAELESLLLD